MADSPSPNLLAEIQYLKAKLERNESINQVARDRAARVQELEAEIQELMERSSVADLDSAVARLRAAQKAEIERLGDEHKAEVEKLAAGWRTVVQTLQMKIERLQGVFEKGKIEELRDELHETRDQLSGSGYRYVKVATYFKVKEELQVETKRREKIEGRLKESQEEIMALMDRVERLEQNRLVRAGPASNSPGIIREAVRGAVDGIRGRRSRGSSE